MTAYPDTNQKNLDTKNLTAIFIVIIMGIMKKAILGFVIVATLAIAGCGVKSDLVRPDPSFPRDYPVY